MGLLFEEACERVKRLKSKPNDNTLLQIYALFKQATVGDCNIDKPSILDMKGRVKWDAWNNLKGLKSESAKQKYIQVIELLLIVENKKS